MIARTYTDYIKNPNDEDKTNVYAYNENLKDKRPQLIFQNYDVISKFLVSVLETDVDRVIVNSKKYL